MISSSIPGSLDALFKEEDELKQLELDIKRRRALVAKARQTMENMSSTHQLAVLLHDRLCRWNHTDGCGWHYAVKDGIHDWAEHSHQLYLRQAAGVMKQLETGVVTQSNVIDFLKETLK
jgi:hypothetical protein